MGRDYRWCVSIVRRRKTSRIMEPFKMGIHQHFDRHPLPYDKEAERRVFWTTLFVIVICLGVLYGLKLWIGGGEV
jgi:hypothetical protein